MKRTPLKRKTQLKRRPMRRKGRDAATKQADALWARTVHSRGQCEVCQTHGHAGSGSAILEAHHARGRGKRFRWRTEYGLLLCAWHHRHSRLLSAHGAPKAFTDWLARYRPAILRRNLPDVETAKQAIARLKEVRDE